MKRIAPYLIAGLLSFITFVVLLAPASSVWLLLKDDVSNLLPDLDVTSVAGTIWNGRAALGYRQFPSTQLIWTLDPLALTGRVAQLRLDLTSDDLHLNADTGISERRITISNLHGSVGSEFINAVSQSQGLIFSGPVEVHEISLIADRSHVLSAGGHISWGGGKIVSKTGSSTQIFALPALEGDFSAVSDGLNLQIHHEDTPALDIRLKPTGWITVTVKAGLFHLAGLTLPTGGNPSVNVASTDTVLEFEEKIF